MDIVDSIEKRHDQTHIDHQTDLKALDLIGHIELVLVIWFADLIHTNVLTTLPSNQNFKLNFHITLSATSTMHLFTEC